MSEHEEFSLKELRYMKQALYYYSHGQSDMTAYSVVIKLMDRAGIKVDAEFEDGIDRAFRLAKERVESKTIDDSPTPRTNQGAPADVGPTEVKPGTVPPLVGNSFTD